MTTKHTPGPWTAAVYEPTPTMLERLKFKQWAVCADDDKTDAKGLLIAMCGEINPGEPKNTEQSFADARLIATAPELLQLAKRFQQYFETYSMQDMEPDVLKGELEKDVFEQVMQDRKEIADVIAKAEGQS